MVAGSYFGEIDIIFKRKRDFQAICELDCDLYYLSRYDYENVLVKEFPHIAESMRSIAKKKEKINNQSIVEVEALLVKDNGSTKENSDPITYKKRESTILKLRDLPTNLSRRDSKFNMNPDIKDVSVDSTEKNLGKLFNLNTLNAFSEAMKPSAKNTNQNNRDDKRARTMVLKKDNKPLINLIDMKDKAHLKQKIPDDLSEASSEKTVSKTSSKDTKEQSINDEKLKDEIRALKKDIDMAKKKTNELDQKIEVIQTSMKEVLEFARKLCDVE